HNRRRSARASSSWATGAMTRRKRPRRPEPPRGSKKPTGPRRRNLLVVSLEILGQDFHRARHVLALKEKNRIRVRLHLFHDVDASGRERPREEGEEARRLLDRLWAGHIDLHEAPRHRYTLGAFPRDTGDRPRARPPSGECPVPSRSSSPGRSS